MLTKIYRYGMFTAILLILAAIAYFMGTLVELGIMMTCFLASKQKYEFKYHCKSSFSCLLLSVGVFVIAMRVTLPVGISYISSAACGLFIAYVAQHEAESKFIREDYAYIEPKYNTLVEEKRCATVYTMGEAELRKFCKANLLDEIDEEIVVQRLMYHLKGKALYDKIGYSKAQMIRREQRIEAKLNIKLKDR